MTKKEETKTAPAEETKKTENVDSKTETTQEETIGEILGNEKKEKKQVPEAVLIQYKKDNRQMKRELEELKAQIAEGASKKEVSSSVKEIAEKFKVDEQFLTELASTMKKEAKSELQEELDAKIKDLQVKGEQEKFEKAFNQTFDKILEQNPEYKGIVRKEVIKLLAKQPENASKTFSKIIEENYGHLIPGKKTMETATAGAGKDTTIDYQKAKTDAEYFKQIMANPALKKKYNEGLEERLYL